MNPRRTIAETIRIEIDAHAAEGRTRQQIRRAIEAAIKDMGPHLVRRIRKELDRQLKEPAK